jgi:hypothetical protein
MKAAILAQKGGNVAPVDSDQGRQDPGQRAHCSPPVTRSSASLRSLTRFENSISKSLPSARTTTSYPPAGPTCRKAARRRLFTRLRATALLHLTASPSLDGPSGRRFANAEATSPFRATLRPSARTRRKSRPLRKEGGFLTRVGLGRQPSAALGSPALDYRAARPGFHPSAETVLALAASDIGLESSLGHGCSTKSFAYRPALDATKAGRESSGDYRGVAGV